MRQGLKLVVNNMEFLRQLSPVRIGACKCDHDHMFLNGVHTSLHAQP